MSKPRLLFIGPMTGRNPGQVTTQGEILADRFATDGYEVLAVSAHPNRYRRLLDIIWVLLTRHRDFDLMLLSIYGGPSFVVEDIASWLAKRFGLPTIFHLHGGALPDFFARWPNWTRRVLRRAQQFVAPSHYLAKAIAPYGFSGIVIPNTIDLANYPFRLREKPEPKFFWMRAFHEVWNPMMALRVFAKVREQMPHAQLIIAGQDLGLQAECQQQARQLGIADAVTFPGFLNPEQKRAYGIASDIYLNTNRIDNMPVAVVEACAFGHAVITTDIGGIPDLLTHEENGLLVPVDDDSAMASTIMRLFNEPGLAATLSNNGRKLAEKSSWDAVRKQWEVVFDTLH